jgi:hypothetical protein
MYFFLPRSNSPWRIFFWGSPEFKYIFYLVFVENFLVFNSLTHGNIYSSNSANLVNPALIFRFFTPFISLLRNKSREFSAGSTQRQFHTGFQPN